MPTSTCGHDISNPLRYFYYQLAKNLKFSGDFPPTLLKRPNHLEVTVIGLSSSLGLKSPNNVMDRIHLSLNALPVHVGHQS